MPRVRLPLDPIEYVAVLDEDGRVDPGLDPGIPPGDLQRLYQTAILSRRFDDRMLRLQRQGRIGTYLSARGHEAAVLGSVYAIGPNDWMVPVWREWPAYVWRGWPLENLILLYAGYPEGTRVPEGIRDLPVCVPMGGQVPHAVGVAHGIRARREAAVVLCYFGDGASSHGDTQEAMNFAGVYGLPLVFVCVNNQWSISMPRARQTRARTLAHRAVAYGFPGVQVDGNDLLGVCLATREAVQRAREGGGPTLIEAVTYRLLGHSTADEPTKYREQAEVDLWEKREPLLRLRRYLEGRGLVDDDRQARWDEEAEATVRAAVERAEARMAAASPEVMFEVSYHTPTAEVEAEHAEWLAERAARGPTAD